MKFNLIIPKKEISSKKSVDFWQTLSYLDGFQ